MSFKDRLAFFEKGARNQAVPTRKKSEDSSLRDPVSPLTSSPRHKQKLALGKNQNENEEKKQDDLLTSSKDFALPLQHSTSIQEENSKVFSPASAIKNANTSSSEQKEVNDKDFRVYGISLKYLLVEQKFLNLNATVPEVIQNIHQLAPNQSFIQFILHSQNLLNSKVTDKPKFCIEIPKSMFESVLLKDILQSLWDKFQEDTFIWINFLVSTSLDCSSVFQGITPHLVLLVSEEFLHDAYKKQEKHLEYSYCFVHFKDFIHRLQTHQIRIEFFRRHSDALRSSANLKLFFEDEILRAAAFESQFVNKQKISVYHAFANFYHVLDIVDEALHYYEQALALQEDENETGLYLCYLNQDYADLLISMNRFSESEKFVRNSIKLSKIYSPDDHVIIALELNTLAFVLKQVRPQEIDEIVRAYEDSIQILQNDNLETYNILLFKTLTNLTTILLEHRRYNEAETSCGNALTLLEKENDIDELELTKKKKPLLIMLGDIYRNQGKMFEARSILEQVISSNDNVKDDETTATLFNNLAQTYDITGDPSKAEGLYRTALEILHQLPRGGNILYLLSVTLHNLASVLSSQQKNEECIPIFHELLEIDRELYSATQKEVIASDLNNLALLITNYNKGEDPNEIACYYQEAISLWKESLGKEHPQVATGLNNYALLLNESGKYDEAIPLFEEAVRIRRNEYEKTHDKTWLPILAKSLLNLATCLKNQGRSIDKARDTGKESYKILLNELGPDHPDTIYARFWEGS